MWLPFSKRRVRHSGLVLSISLSAWPFTKARAAAARTEEPLLISTSSASIDSSSLITSGLNLNTQPLYFLGNRIRTTACAVNLAPPSHRHRSLSMSMSANKPQDSDSNERMAGFVFWCVFCVSSSSDSSLTSSKSAASKKHHPPLATASAAEVASHGVCVAYEKDFASAFPEPVGTTPTGSKLPFLFSSQSSPHCARIPFRTSATVPSPPTHTTPAYKSRSRRKQCSNASPLFWVIKTSNLDSFRDGDGVDETSFTVSSSFRVG
mmetsp:Transcript_4008/g.13389  ORF Transcript_4008/g.13389 Transcript_4008/m.13389 type:complete len:264 (-) Transcript_4008:386-1177(-)